MTYKATQSDLITYTIIRQNYKLALNVYSICGNVFGWGSMVQWVVCLDL